MRITITLKPIAEAPIRNGDEFGPCVLAVGTDWKLGCWTGDGWLDREGDPVMPSQFALLPPTEAQLRMASARRSPVAAGTEDRPGLRGPAA